MKTRIDIPAIHDKDLKEILEKLGLFEKLEKGELLCINCDKVITMENLSALKVVGNEIVVFCDEIECIEISTDK